MFCSALVGYSVSLDNGQRKAAAARYLELDCSLHPCTCTVGHNSRRGAGEAPGADCVVRSVVLLMFSIDIGRDVSMSTAHIHGTYCTASYL